MTVATANGKHTKPAPKGDPIDAPEPHDLQAEMGVLGSVVLMPTVLDNVAKILPGARAFYDLAHQKFYRHMVGLFTDGKGGRSIDHVLLANRMKEAGDWESAGGSAYLSKIINSVPNAAHATYYAEIVQEKFLLRQRRETAIQILARTDRGEPLEEIDSYIAEAMAGSQCDAADEIGPPLSLEQMREQFPTLAEPVIHGLLRKGETLNLIAATKVGKSWGTYEVAFRVATGGRLWDTYTCVPGSVLIIDNELPASVLTDRLLRVSTALELEPSDWQGKIVAQTFRGRLLDIDGIYQWLKTFVKPGQFKLIIFDAYYRMLPNGTNENENGQITSVANTIDSLGREFDTAIMLVHHSSKGNQSGKAVTDVGSGASAMARAADTHLVLRPHEENGVVVMDAALRSWPPVEPLCLRWDFPLWRRADALDPAALKSEKPKTTITQVAKAVLECLQQNGPLTRSVMRAKLQKSGERINEAVEVLLTAGQIEACDIQTGRGTHTGYQVKTSTLDSLDSPTFCPTSSNVDGHP